MCNKSCMYREFLAHAGNYLHADDGKLYLIWVPSLRIGRIWVPLIWWMVKFGCPLKSIHPHPPKMLSEWSLRHEIYNEMLFVLYRYKRSPAQMMLRWSVQHKFIPIPKSQSQPRIQENAAIFDFSISDEDMELMVCSTNLRTQNSELRHSFIWPIMFTITFRLSNNIK